MKLMIVKDAPAQSIDNDRRWLVLNMGPKTCGIIVPNEINTKLDLYSEIYLIEYHDGKFL